MRTDQGMRERGRASILPDTKPALEGWILPGVLGVVVLVGTVIAVSPELGVLLALVVGVGGVLLSRPEYAAAAVAFLLWSNAPVVAMREHGVPQAVASGYLLLLLLPILQPFVHRLRFGSWEGREPLQWSSALPWVALYVGIGVLSAMHSRDPARSIEGVKEQFLEGLVVFALASFAVRDRASLRRATWGLLCAGAFMGVIALVHQISGRFESSMGGFSVIDSGFGTGEVTTQGRAEQPRLAGPIGEKNRFGQIMIVLVVLGVGLARSERSRGLRRTAYAFAGLSAIGAALTFSRGNALAFVLLMPLMLALGAVSRRQLVGVGVAGALLLLALPQYRERLATIPAALLFASGKAATAEAPDNAVLGRATEVVAAGLVYLDHPVLGVGPGLFKTYCAEYGNTLGLRRLDGEREAHTMFPHVAAEGGTLGLVAFCGALLTVLAGLVRGVRSRGDPERQGLCSSYLLGLAAYIACGLFLHMSFVRYYWFLLGLAAAAVSVTSRTTPAASRVVDARESIA